MVMSHFKNDSIKGTQHIPLAEELVEPLIMQHLARSKYAPQCKSLFFSKSFVEIQYEYFYTLAGDALTLPGRHRISSGKIRCMYETLWRDFMHCLGFKLLDIARAELDRAAAEGMLSSTVAVDASYDRGDRDRGYDLVQPYWPYFVQFVQDHFETLQSRQPWNFVTDLPNIEGLTLHALS